jgi:outer membrane lipoprotein-sorting protein
MSNSRPLPQFCLFLAVACLAFAGAGAAEPAIIAKARAYIGPEAALEQVNSLHYTGTLTISESDPAANVPPPLGIDILFQKPSRQRSVITAAQRIETTVLDGYEAWQKVQDPADATRWSLSLMEADQIRSLRANVAENLFFFRALARSPDAVADLGAATVDGVACQKIAFVHSASIAFYRYFDVATGRLVLTETSQGEKIRELGQIMAGGLRFPKTLVTTMTRPDGSVQRMTIDFEMVTVNEAFPDSLFAMPVLSGM